MKITELLFYLKYHPLKTQFNIEMLYDICIKIIEIKTYWINAPSNWISDILHKIW